MLLLLSDTSEADALLKQKAPGVRFGYDKTAVGGRGTDLTVVKIPEIGGNAC